MEKDTTTQKIDNPAAEETYLEMAKAGVMYGHKRLRRDPHFEPYVFAIRNGIEIIDLEKTIIKISEVAQKLKEAVNDGKNILVVGVQVSAREATKNLAEKLNSPYVVNKWIGGLITNFKAIRGRINYFLEQKKNMEEGKFSEYTKKEQLDIQRKINKMSERFEGLENYLNVPDMMFVIDSSTKGHKIAIAEAKERGIKILGVIDNDDNPRNFDDFIPANDHSKTSIDWVINRIISEI